jgi:hypothetical protein
MGGASAPTHHPHRSRPYATMHPRIRFAVEAGDNPVSNLDASTGTNGTFWVVDQH